MKKNTIYFVLILIGAIIFGLYYFGIIQEVKITEQEIGPFKVVYEAHIGDYSKVSEVQEKIYNSLVLDEINTTKSFGVYYDNPDEVEKQRLRSEIGVIINEKDYSKIMRLKGKYNVKDIPKEKSIVAVFPYRNKVSIIIGIYKVYPKLDEYIKNNNYEENPILEIYDKENQKIYYTMGIK